MTKMIKMSLVAAVAVAGISSTASAKQNLAEWAKATTLSGYVRYRLNTNHEASNTNAAEEAKLIMNLNTPVDDATNANIKLGGVNGNYDVLLANFTTKMGAATVIAGLQNTASPFFATNGDTRAHGLVALVPAGAATIAAAHYTSNTANGGTTNDISALGVLAKAGSVGINAWHAQVQNNGTIGALIDDASATSVEVTANVGAVNVAAMSTTLDDGANTGSLTKITAAGKAGNVSWMAGYAMTGDEVALADAGGRVTIDGDSDANSDLAMHVLSMGDTTDATAFVASATMPVGSVKATLAYLAGSEGDKGNDESFNELNVKAAFNISKNLKAAFTYAMGEYNKGDIEQSRLEAKYSF
jgi:hypothetical protein